MVSVRTVATASEQQQQQVPETGKKQRTLMLLKPAKEQQRRGRGEAEKDAAAAAGAGAATATPKAPKAKKVESPQDKAKREKEENEAIAARERQAAPAPVDAFFDPEMPGSTKKVGRSWRINELRLKSFEDLQQLHFVLLRERNMLLSEKLRYRRLGAPLPRFERARRVRQSMARIQTVLSERARQMKAARQAYRVAEAQAALKLAGEAEAATNESRGGDAKP